MKMNVKLAFVTILGSIAVEGYGPNFYQGHRGPSHHHGHHHGFHHGSSNHETDSHLENLGRNGPYGRYGVYDGHGHDHGFHHDRPHYWHNSEDSREIDPGYREPDNDNFNMPEHNNWHGPERRPCWGGRCPPQDEFESWTKSPHSNIATPEVPSDTELHVIDLIMLYLSQRGTLESVITSTPVLTLSPNADNIRLKRIESTEKVASMKATTSVPDLVVSADTVNNKVQNPATTERVSFEETTTTNSALTASPNAEYTMLQSSAPTKEVPLNEIATTTPDINSTTMSTPEITTVSQAVLDCIENCISTPEFSPVCGTNGETYNNIGKLFCAKNCGIDVELQRMSRCFPVFPFADDYEDYAGNSNSDNGSNNNAYPDFENGGEDGRESRLRQTSGAEGGETSQPPNGELLQPSSDRPLGGEQLGREPLKPLESEQPQPLGGEQPLPLSAEPLQPTRLLGNGGKPSQSLNNESPQVEDGRPSSPPPGSDVNIIVTPASDQPRTTTIPRLSRTTHLTSLQMCMKQCPINVVYNPICGTDLVTYMNVDRIECARGCGLEVQILCEQPCHVCNLGTQTLSSTTTSSTMTSPVTASSVVTFSTAISTTTLETIQSSTDAGKTTPATLKEQCIKSCPITTEYSPVCGTNNVNYTNAVQLLCAQMCGDDVMIAKFGPCLYDTSAEPPDITAELVDIHTQPSDADNEPRDIRNERRDVSTEPPETSAEVSVVTPPDDEDVTLPPEVIQCIRRCVVTPEYNPVCGTNEETYVNPGRLECAKYCGIVVEVGYKGLCNGFFFSGFTSSKPNHRTPPSGAQATASWEIPRHTTVSPRLPLRTSPVVTMQSTLTSTLPISTMPTSTIPTTLQSNTFQSTQSSTSPFSITSTDQSPVTSLSTTQPPNATNFTISPDILFSIFNFTLTEKPTTEMNSVEENFSLDPRYGNENDKTDDKKENFDPNRIVFPDD